MSEGYQQRVIFEPGDQSIRPLCDVKAKRTGLLRLSAVGDCLFRLTYGTSSQMVLDGLRSPLVAYVPGGVYLEAQPTTAGGALAQCSVVEVDGPGDQIVRRLYSSAGNIDSHATRATCLTAGTVQTAGTNVALTPGQSIALAGPSAVVSGAFLVELDL